MVSPTLVCIVLIMASAAVLLVGWRNDGIGILIIVGMKAAPHWTKDPRGSNKTSMPPPPNCPSIKCKYKMQIGWSMEGGVAAVVTQR